MLLAVLPQNLYVHIVEHGDRVENRCLQASPNPVISSDWMGAVIPVIPSSLTRIGRLSND